MLADALRRLLARLVAAEPEATPEMLELERRAQVAMTACTCGHMWHLHEHAHIRTGCDACPCERFRPAVPPPPLAGRQRSDAATTLLIRLRVSVWTHAWREPGSRRPVG